MFNFELAKRLTAIQQEYPENVTLVESCNIVLNRLNTMKETQVLENTLSMLHRYSHLTLVEETINECVKIAKENHNRYLVEKKVTELNVSSDAVARTAMRRLNAIVTESKSEGEIAEKIKTFDTFDFIPGILEMRKAILKNANSVIPDGEFKISPVYSPVKMIGESVLFGYKGRTYFYNTKDNTISENLNRVDSAFSDLCTLVENCSINGDTLTYVYGDKTYATNGEEFKINGKVVENVFNSILKSVPISQPHIAKMIYRLHEEKQSIVSLDFASEIRNRVHNTNECRTLFNTGQKTYIVETNRLNGKNIFSEVTVNEAKQSFNEIGYNITESIGKFARQEQYKKNQLLEEKKIALGKIAVIESQLQDVNSDTEMISEAKDDLVVLLQKKLAEVQDDLKKLQQELNQSVKESLEDEGYVKAIVSLNYRGLKKGQDVYVNAQEYASKGKLDEIEYQTNNKIKGKIKKGLVKIEENKK